MIEVVVTTGAIGRAKLQSNRHQQQTNIQFFTGRIALPVTQPKVSLSLSLSLSVLTAMRTWVSRCLLKQRMMEVVVTTGAIGHATLQSNHYQQQTNTVFYRPDVLPITQPTVSKHLREKYHIPWTCLPQAQLRVFQLCL